MTIGLRACLAAAVAALVLGASSPPARGFEPPAGARLDQAAMFRAVAAMYGLDPDLLAAVARVESAGRSNAVSPAGAMGLMQLMPATAARYRVADPFDPVQNALGAARFIAHMRGAGACVEQTQETPWSIAQMLAAYNAGEGAVCRYGGMPPYPETRDYVGRVLWVYLMGQAPPRPAGAHAASGLPRSRVGYKRHGTQGALEQLDELRRARSAAARTSRQESPPR